MDFKKVVIVGGGVLGSQIALQVAYCEFEVTILLRSEASIERAKEKIENFRKAYLSVIEKMKEGGPYPKGITNESKLTNEQIDELKQKIEKANKSIVYTTSIEEACKNADLVIESIAENLQQKKEMYQKLSKHLEDKTIIVTNSSTLLPSTLAPYTGRPEKFLGYHFLNEIWTRNVTEIMGHPGTDKKCYDIMEEFSKKINMIPVKMYKEKPGYIFNSLLDPFLVRAAGLWADGIADPQTIDTTWSIPTGMIGPFKIIDLVGINTFLNIRLMDDTANTEGSLSYKIIQKLKEMKEAGKLGKCSGEGFYKYK